MIILHTGSFNNHLFVWGEKPLEKDSVSSAQQSQKAKTVLPVQYLYDAGNKDLAKSLQEVLPDSKAVSKKVQKAIVWLPTKGSIPIPSGSIIAEPPKSRAKMRLAPWTVAIYQPSIEETVELLCKCSVGRTLKSGILIGDDLVYWSKAFRFAGSLVTRQQYLPGLTTERGTHRSVWEPVFAGNDSELLADLAIQMPAVGRALSGLDATSPPEIPASVILNQFLTTSVDYLVRSSYPEQIGPKGKRGRKKKTAFDSIHDAWLYSLRNKEPTIEAEQAELVQLAEQITQWRRPIVVSTASPFRLCLRLEEPDESKETDSTISDNGWYVRYLLQPYKDPSLLIPFEDAWKTRSRKTSVLEKYGSDAKEYMLSALGQASGICPLIAASLESAAPAGYELDVSGAYDFLNNKAISLEQAGFGVMLPAWWTRKGTKLKLSASANVKSPKMQGGNVFSLESIVKFDWSVALGDKKLTLEELEALAKLKAPLVKIRGQWVEMNATEIQTAIDFWKKNSSEKATVRDIIQMTLGAKKTYGGFQFGGVKASGWIGRLLEQLNGNVKFEELAVNETFSGTLRPYQVRGFSWLSFLRKWGMGACLADDMGLGKTIQTLALIQRDWHANGKVPVMLVCPTSIVNNWQKEASRFTPDIPVMVHHGIGRHKEEEFIKEAKKHAIVISSYGLLQRDLKFLKGVQWAGVVLDEAQNIKNPETKQSKAARSLKADYRIALTGTPVENNVGDLWSIMEFLNPGFLGTQAEFKRNFFIPIQAIRDQDAAKRLKRITSPFILRRLKTDKSIISDLPEKQEMKVFCTLTKEQASLYKATLREAEDKLKSSEGIQRKGVILGLLSKLKQVCNHPTQFLGDNSAIPGRSGKLARLTEMLEEIIEVGDRALVFSQFSEMGSILQRYLQDTFGYEVLFLHGAVSRKRRDQMVERFQGKDNGPPIFILSLKAGGTGLNLTGANHVFHFDRWWNPAVENQATDRAFRIGQKRNVQVHKFICAGTLEDKIDEMIERKKEITENVLGTGEGWLTELSNKELKNIFALRKEAIGS